MTKSRKRKRVHRVGEASTTLADFEGYRIDRDRGEPRSSAPPTPPCVRVRTRRVALTRLEQGWETERFEVRI